MSVELANVNRHWNTIINRRKTRNSDLQVAAYLLVHREDPAEDDVTIDAYQLRAVLASFLHVVTLARDQEAPHPRQDPVQAHLDHWD